jgi:hypothetical protein
MVLSQHEVTQGIHGSANGFCSQNTLKDKRLEHRSYRQERNFIDRERLSREMHSGVQKLSDP